MPPRIVLGGTLQTYPPEGRERWVARLGEEFPGWQVDLAESASTVLDYPWHEVRAMTCLDLPARGVPANVALLQAVTTGVEHLPLTQLARSGVHVCNAAGTAAREIAEFVMSRILEDAKRLPVLRAAQAEHRWQPAYGEGLDGSELLLVGFGEINRSVATLARAFGMTVRVVRRDPGREQPEGVVEQRGSADLVHLIGLARYVVCALPQTSATTALIDHAVVDGIRDGALLVNVGRGSALDEEAVRAACASGRIRAALDVFDTEPLPTSSPWWTTPGVSISAHCASVPALAMNGVEDLFIGNLHRLLAGAPLINQVAGPTGPIKEFP